MGHDMHGAAGSVGAGAMKARRHCWLEGERMARRRESLRVARLVYLVLLVLCLLTGCTSASIATVQSSSAPREVSSEETAPGSPATAQPQVAATILSHDIAESEVTAYIDSYRNGLQRTDEASWADYLAKKGITAQELRTTTIYELAAPIVIQAKAEELGITVDQAAVDAQVEGLRHSLLVEDEGSWNDELGRYGMTEEKLRENFSNKNLEEQVFDQIMKDYEPTDADLKTYAADNLAGLTTKRVGCVYDDEFDNVRAVLEEVKQAASVEEGIAELKNHPEDGGVSYAAVGWDLNADLTAQMSNVVASLEVGQVADEPLTEGGMHYLFYVEDAYTFPAEASKVDISDADLKQALFEVASASLKKASGGVWLQQQIEENIAINDMPAGLSYDVEPHESPELASDNAASKSGASARSDPRDEKR